jgi:WD40 repeat protein
MEPTVQVKVCNAMRVIDGHFDIVLLVTYSPDGLRIVSGSQDKVWDAISGGQLHTPEGHLACVPSVAFSSGQHAHCI